MHIIQKIRISEQAYNWEQAQRQFFQKYRISQSDIFTQKARSLIGTDLPEETELNLGTNIRMCVPM